MKFVKRIVVFFVFLALLCTLVGCGLSFDKPPFSYTFRQDRSNITKIEICAYEHEYAKDGGPMTPLAEIAEEDVDSFLDDIQALDCREFIMYDSIVSYGDLIVRILYSNGEAEIIGMYNIGWMSADNVLELTRYWFHYDDISEVIARYVDPRFLADYCGHFKRLVPPAG